jgi:transcriptional regulator GlxA family with amidase domain
MARRSSQTIATADALVARAVQFLEQNLARDTVLTDMVAGLGVSRRTLELRFNAALGQTPGRELLRLKIERAQALLATTSLPLKQIAVLAGFGTAIRMRHVFRHLTGQSPTGYRRGFLLH